MNRGYYGGPLQPSLVRAGMFINVAVRTRTEPHGEDLPVARLLGTPAGPVERVVSRPHCGGLAGDKAARNASLIS